MKKISILLAVLFSLGMALATPQIASAAQPSCASGYYQNSVGSCVHRPQKSNSAPAGASAQCRDGSYSFSQSRRGTCSHHGGVATWL